MPDKNEYDGFYFLPGDEEGDLTLAYFKFNGEIDYGKPVESSNLGDKFHIAFFRRDGNGNPVFDEQFEAIFVDPSTYVRNFIDSDIYGCVLRKTENSAKWWEEYLTRAKEACIMFQNESEQAKS